MFGSYWTNKNRKNYKLKMNTKALYWKNILSAAAVLGLLYGVQIVLGYLARHAESNVVGTMLSLYGFGVIVWVLLFFGRRAERIKNVDGVGYNYSQAFGFSLLVLVLSGIIVGVVQWFLQNVIDPVYYTEIYKQTLTQMTKGLSPEQIKMAKGSLDIMKSIWGMVGSMIFTMLMLGGLVALGTSAMVKKGPKL